MLSWRDSLLFTYAASGEAMRLSRECDANQNQLPWSA